LFRKTGDRYCGRDMSIRMVEHVRAPPDFHLAGKCSAARKRLPSKSFEQWKFKAGNQARCALETF
jgi:hypothetical protein